MSMSAKDLLHQANAEFGQTCDFLVVSDDSKHLVEEVGDRFNFKEGAKLILSTQEKVIF